MSKARLELSIKRASDTSDALHHISRACDAVTNLSLSCLAKGQSQGTTMLLILYNVDLNKTKSYNKAMR
jgi:hypothetical protein